MEKLKQYLQNPDKNYLEGIDLLTANGGSNEELIFFKSGNGNKMHFDMLVKKLNNILRIKVQNPPKKEEEPLKISTKPIAVKKLHFSEVEKDLKQTKLLINKLLARNWSEIDQKERKLFNNDSQIFEAKKAKLIENSKIESELKTLHAELQLATDDDIRQTIADRLVSMKKSQTENWRYIDSEVKVEAKIQDIEQKPVDKSDLIIRRNNLRARVSKAAKKAKEKPGDDTQQKLEELQLELADIEKLI